LARHISIAKALPSFDVIDKGDRLIAEYGTEFGSEQISLQNLVPLHPSHHSATTKGEAQLP
jgi:hypothetical protein